MEASECRMTPRSDLSGWEQNPQSAPQEAAASSAGTTKGRRGGGPESGCHGPLSEQTGEGQPEPQAGLPWASPLPPEPQLPTGTPTSEAAEGLYLSLAQSRCSVNGGWLAALGVLLSTGCPCSRLTQVSVHGCVSNKGHHLPLRGHHPGDAPSSQGRRPGWGGSRAATELRADRCPPVSRLDRTSQQALPDRRAAP